MLQEVSSQSINPLLQNIVEQIEVNAAGTQVLAAQIFQYPVLQVAVTVSVSRSRPINILEEFVLRAGLELDPPPTACELASVLGLDFIFIQDTISQLATLQCLSLDHADRLQVTPQGAQFYAQGLVSQPTEKKQAYFLRDELTKETKFSEELLPDIPPELNDLRDFVELDLLTLSTFELDLSQSQSLLEVSKLNLHNPTDGSFVTEVIPEEDPNWCWRAISLFLLYDNLNSQISLQARSELEILPQLSDWLDQQRHNETIDLMNLFDVSREDIAVQINLHEHRRNEFVEQRLKVVQEKYIEQLHKELSAVSVQKEGTIRQLRDSQIAKAFTDTLRSAREEVIIFSPWISESVVDRRFSSLLQERVSQGVRFLIGYGISQSEADEDRLIPPEVVERLQSIHTPEGFPGVVLLWLGNSHAKEIVVDRRVHLSGSHNWLSYRGDYLPRGETVYEITVPDPVNQAHQYLSKCFMQRIVGLWDSNNEQNRATALYTLGALRLESKALYWIQQAQDPTQLPVWLSLAHHAACIGQVARILDDINAALDFCTSIETDDLLTSSSDGFCREVITLVYSHS